MTLHLPLVIVKLFGVISTTVVEPLMLSICTDPINAVAASLRALSVSTMQCMHGC